MLTIQGRNVNEVFRVAMTHFRQTSVLIESCPRGERRLQYPYPITSHYARPCERVLFDAKRDANPFFHFMEALWIISGRNDVAWIEQWISTLRKYSDNGITFHGAYGARLRAGTQFEDLLHRLRTEQNTTRAVLQIYDHDADSSYRGNDMPCNCMIFFGLHDNRLNMTVLNRSNDMIWGAYGANVVHFSMLQEYIAGHLGCDVGWYEQVSNNAHIYPDNDVTERCLSFDEAITDWYLEDYYPRVQPFSMCRNSDIKVWDRELKLFMQGYEGPWRTAFFPEVVMPMRQAHRAYKSGNYLAAVEAVMQIAATDWSTACHAWILRRAAKKGISV